MIQKLMILGAGVYQVPLIKAAKAKGLEVITISPKGPYPGINLSHKNLDIDTTDIEAILKVAKQYKIDGITTTGTDVAIPAIGAVVDALSLPGTGYKSAITSMNKILMKEAFKKNSIPTADFAIATSLEEANIVAKSIGYPVMVKAIDSSGSRGITRVTSPLQLFNAFNYSLSITHAKEIIIEKCLEGTEFGAHAFIQKSKVISVICHNHTVTGPPISTPVGHSMPVFLDNITEQKTIEIIKKAVKAIGITDAISNLDMMLCDGKPNIIELSARMGATCLPENIFLWAGFDPYDYLIETALGFTPDIPSIQGQPNAGLLLQSPKSGIVSKCFIPKEVLSDPDLIKVNIDVKLGDYVRKFIVGPDRIGEIIVKGTNAQLAEKKVKELANLIKISISTNNG